MKTLQRIGLFLFFLACGLLVFIVFSHYFPSFERPADTIGRVILATAFLVAEQVARHSERFNKYWLILFAFLQLRARMSY